MTVLLYMIPMALLIGLVWLAAFVWALRNDQYDDLDGAARRILIDDDENSPPDPGQVDESQG